MIASDNVVDPRAEKLDGLLVQLLSFKALVTSNCPLILHELGRMYPAAINVPRNAAVAVGPRYIVSETCVHTTDSEYALYKDGQAIGLFRSAAALLYQVERLIWAAVSREPTNHLL